MTEPAKSLGFDRNPKVYARRMATFEGERHLPGDGPGTIPPGAPPAGAAPWREHRGASGPHPSHPLAAHERLSPAAPHDRNLRGCPPPQQKEASPARSDASPDPAGLRGAGALPGEPHVAELQFPAGRGKALGGGGRCACALLLSSMATVLSRALKLPGKGSAPAAGRE